MAYRDDHGCYLCLHRLNDHDLVVGCTVCDCMATPAEGNRHFVTAIRDAPGVQYPRKEPAMSTLSDSVYLVIEPGRRYGNPPQAHDFKITDMRKGKPTLRGEQIAVKLVLDIDAAIFNEYIPTVKATIESAAIIMQEPEIRVVYPGQEIQE